MTPLRIGVVGAGYIAGRHVDHLAGLPDVTVAGVADPRADRATALAGRAGCPAYRNAAELLAAGHLDALYLCVPPAGHGDLEIAALDRGLPLFVEKPLAADLATAERVAAAVAAAGVPVTVGYHWRYLDTVEHARELLAGSPARMVLGAWLDTAPRTDWWARQELSGGQTVEQVTHLVDLARHLIGEIATVHAEGARTAGGPGDILDVSTAAVRFETGAIGSFSSTCLLARGHRIELEVIAPGLAVTLREQGMTIDHGSGPVAREAVGDPMQRADEAFVAAVRGDASGLRVDYPEALRSHALAVRIATAAERSADAGSPDAGSPDAGSPDAGSPDAGSAEAGRGRGVGTGSGTDPRTGSSAEESAAVGHA